MDNKKNSKTNLSPAQKSSDAGKTQMPSKRQDSFHDRKDRVSQGDRDMSQRGPRTSQQDTTGRRNNSGRVADEDLDTEINSSRDRVGSQEDDANYKQGLDE